ncbi:glycosyltransferase [Methanolobus profundi]|uniref:Glycosyltransferase, catalytic subunit of cellulose synthase and poly-beta-1,6-N-acetylglucosamine synthase n=1 Tax=Methanolobus profundi TaxID=487685 RepID=A0A1I4UJK2_9EURY|nr:glycosyltransferase [Methanolobus profundi]SFM88903.1 Glycosyltransferase, catalytic subunit of cellulose synthase and poly-beta-1,6-N-acetylglucosamine synthase [Methanolobus profundi]
MIDLVLIWQLLVVFEVALFSSYTLVMYIYSKKEEQLPINNKLPTVTLVIPMYNEEKVIREKIENTSLIDYPEDKLEVIILDDYSTDSSEVISTKAINESSLKARVVKNDGGKGKARGLNWIFSKISSDITVITDSDALLKEDALLQIIKNFTDPKIGGATGKIVILSDKARFSKSQEDSYRFYFDVWRQGESKIASVSVCNGPLMGFRTELLHKIKIDPNAYADDSDMLYKIIKLGYRVVYDKKAVVYERVPLTVKGRTIQKMKRINGLRKVYLNNFQLIGKGRFGKIIYPYALLTHIVSPLVILLLTILYPLVMLKEPLYLGFLILLVLPKIGKIAVSFVTTQLIMNFSFLVPTGGSWEAVEDARYDLNSTNDK